MNLFHGRRSCIGILDNSLKILTSNNFRTMCRYNPYLMKILTNTFFDLYFLVFILILCDVVSVGHTIFCLQFPFFTVLWTP